MRKYKCIKYIMLSVLLVVLVLSGCGSRNTPLTPEEIKSLQEQQYGSKDRTEYEINEEVFGSTERPVNESNEEEKIFNPLDGYEDIYCYEDKEGNILSPEEILEMLQQSDIESEEELESQEKTLEIFKRTDHLNISDGGIRMVVNRMEADSEEALQFAEQKISEEDQSPWSGDRLQNMSGTVHFLFLYPKEQPELFLSQDEDDFLLNYTVNVYMDNMIHSEEGDEVLERLDILTISECYGNKDATLWNSVVDNGVEMSSLGERCRMLEDDEGVTMIFLSSGLMLKIDYLTEDSLSQEVWNSMILGMN